MGRYEYTAYGRLARVQSSDVDVGYRGAPLGLSRRCKLTLADVNRSDLNGSRESRNGSEKGRVSIPKYPGQTITLHTYFKGVQFGSLSGIGVAFVGTLASLISKQRIKADKLAYIWTRSILGSTSIGVIYSTYKLISMHNDDKIDIKTADAKAFRICNSDEVKLMNFRSHAVSLSLATLASLFMSSSAIVTSTMYIAG
jgi:hypothetical protein